MLLVMACEIITTPGAVFVLWGQPTPADMDRVAEALEKAAAACGHPVVYVTRVPVAAPPPGAAARARLNKLMPVIAQWFSSYHVVLEGVGFGAALKRGILVGLFQLSWRHRTFFVHSLVSEVPASVSAEVRPAVNELIRAATAKGLLSAGPPNSMPPPPRFGASRAA
jgi:hypothetical protein